MYKRFRFTKKISLTFHTFRRPRKTTSIVYYTGIRNWVADDSYNYSIVLGLFRIIFSIERSIGCCKI
jgi:hypothetical protein